MNTTNKIVQSAFFFIIMSCTNKSVFMTGYASEGMTTSIITFYTDGSYSISDKTFLSTDRIKGEYSIKDSLIIMNTLEDNRFLRSNNLLLKKDSFDNDILLQLDKNMNIDTSLIEFSIQIK